MSDSELAVVARPNFPNHNSHRTRRAVNPKKFFEFFTVPIRNANTRAAYYRAIQQFLAWAERAGYQHLEDIEPITVAAYIEIFQRQAAPFQCKNHRWSGVRATVDGQIRPGDVGGLRTSDERHQRGDLINMPIAPVNGDTALDSRCFRI